MKKWYVVNGQDDEYYNERNCWTISTHPNRLGWENDSGYNGYGLPKEVAEYIVNILNEQGGVPEWIGVKYDLSRGGFEKRYE